MPIVCPAGAAVLFLHDWCELAALSAPLTLRNICHICCHQLSSGVLCLPQSDTALQQWTKADSDYWHCCHLYTAYVVAEACDGTGTDSMSSCIVVQQQ